MGLLCGNDTCWGAPGARSGRGQLLFRELPTQPRGVAEREVGGSESRSVAQGTTLLRRGLRSVLGCEKLGCLAQKDPQTLVWRGEWGAQEQASSAGFSSPRLSMDSANYPRLIQNCAS